MQRNLIAIFISLFISVFIFSGCAFISGLGGHTYEADTAYNNKQYDEAYEMYYDYIESRKSRGRDIEPEIYEKAGISAHKLDKNSEAIEFLSLANQNSVLSAEGFLALAKSYREIDNLTLEIRNLEAYLNNYPDEPDFDEVQIRYFETLVEGRNWHEAYELWDELGKDRFENEKMLENYLIVNRYLEKDASATGIAKKILEINNENIVALDWLAKNYYYQALNRYNYEMQAYERNRTHRQYAQLREAWPVIHADYRTSRDYFMKLYEIEPKGEYARFLANIYERLNDDVKARYYRQRIN